MTRVVGTPLRGVEFSNAGDEVFSARIAGDSVARVRIDAGGRLTWSTGAVTGDTNLYRSGADVLKTDDVFEAAAGVITLTSSGAPTATLSDGALAVDTTNDALYIRSGSNWIEVKSGANVPIQSTAPAGAEVGDLWFDSSDNTLYILDTDGVTWLAVSTGSLNDLEDVTLTSAANGEILQYNGSEWVNTVQAGNEPIGHENKADSTVSFDNGTRTFSIAPVGASYTVWCKGRRYVKSSTETVTIGTTTGLYYIYFSNTGVLSYKTTYFDWENDTPTAYIYWNATTSKAEFFADERHGVTLDWQTHEYLHRTRGAVIANGFGANNYVLDGDGSSDSHAQLGLAGGTFFDEDLQIDITHSASPTANTWQQVLNGTAEIPVFYLSGSAWVKDTATTFPFKAGSSRATYNLNTAGTWTTPDVQNNKYGAMWIAATNNLNEPIIAILGQTAADNQSQIEERDWSDLVLPDFPIFEFRPLYKLIFVVGDNFSNTPKVALRGVTDLRRIGSTGDGIPSEPVSDHGTMTGLSDDDHLQYLTEARHDAHDHSTAMSTVVLDDISDVNFSFVAPAQGDILYFDGSDWVNFPLKIENSGDVVLSSITAGDFLKWDGSDWVNDAIDLGTDTVGDYVTSLVAGTGITLSNNSGEGATPTVEIGQDVATTANVTFNDLILTGDLTVQGNTTTLETATLQVEDNIVVLNYGQTTPTLDAGIQIERGSGTDVTLRWNESLDYWDFTNDGTTYYKLITALDDISDVDLTSTAPTSGDVLKFDGTNWVPDAIDLGTDTTGDFVQSLVAGTGVTLANNSGENATPTIAIGQSVETTDDVTFNTLTATAGVITLTSSGAPTSTIADGALAVDTTNDILYVRSNGSWVESSGGASVTVSDAAPAAADVGDLWYESDTGKMLVYYDSYWVEVGVVGENGSASGTVKVTGNDTTGDVLTSKVVAGENVTLTVLNSGASEQLEVSVPSLAAYTIALGG